MRKYSLLAACIVSAISLSSCQSIFDFWAAKHDYTLTVDDRRVIGEVFGSAFANTIQAHIYTKDLSSNNPGMYSPNAREIWMNSNTEITCYDVVHEATHYFQHNNARRDLGDENQSRQIPADLSHQIGAEPEAYLVELYTYFHDGYRRGVIDGVLYYDTSAPAYKTYIDSILLAQR
jgi:hypothetical protein